MKLSKVDALGFPHDVHSKVVINIALILYITVRHRNCYSGVLVIMSQLANTPSLTYTAYSTFPLKWRHSLYLDCVDPMLMRLECRCLDVCFTLCRPVSGSTSSSQDEGHVISLRPSSLYLSEASCTWDIQHLPEER